jgi:hypothetical protein
MYVGNDFSEINVGEEVPLTLDFVNDLNSGESIDHAQQPSWVCTVTSGIDSTPDDCWIEPPTIEGTATTRLFGNAKAGVTYRVTATILSTDGATLILYSHIPCRAQV